MCLLLKCIVIESESEKSEHLKWKVRVKLLKSLSWEGTVWTIAEVGCIVIESESEQKLTSKVESESEIA